MTGSTANKPAEKVSERYTKDGMVDQLLKLKDLTGPSSVTRLVRLFGVDKIGDVDPADYEMLTSVAIVFNDIIAIRDADQQAEASRNKAKDKPSPEWEFEQARQKVFPVPGYDRLAACLEMAYNQAARGKGAERHANGLPFHEQRIQRISQALNSPDGMAYQVCKKVADGLDLPTLERQLNEMCGAIVYVAGIMIYLTDASRAEG